MAFVESTTWTIGRILGRLQESGDEVVVFAGHHQHRGVIRALGEHLLTLASGDDMLAIDLASVSGVRLLGQVPAIASSLEPVEEGELGELDDLEGLADLEDQAGHDVMAGPEMVESEMVESVKPAPGPRFPSGDSMEEWIRDLRA